MAIFAVRGFFVFAYTVLMTTSIDAPTPTADALRKHLLTRLQQPLPGRAAQRRAAPSLSYGRHYGPPLPNARRAAVLIFLCPSEANGFVIPLTVRPQALSHHPGQVALPGGRQEANESLEETARRETIEELGPDAIPCQWLGQLSDVYVFASNNIVRPFVAWCDRRPTWTPDPSEVEQVIELPLQTLHPPVPWTHQSIHRAMRGAEGNLVPGVHFRAPAIVHDNHCIWGATAMILAELSAVLHPC
jgi:8-oxo-dGTP pyrophosphatase MutT (NUDIX family)